MKKADAHIDTIEFLDRRYDKTKQRQTENGVDFKLTRGEYWSLVCRHPTALKRINRRYLKWLLGERKKPFRAGYVLTWINRPALEGKIMDKTTVTFVNAETSKKNCFFKKGDQMPEEIRLKISAAKTGMEFAEQHKQRLSEAALRRWAKYRAEKEAVGA